MGAWGPGFFQDDMALDAAEELIASDNPEDFLRRAFETVMSADHVGYDSAHAAIVSAVVVDARLNGREHLNDEAALLAWAETLQTTDVSLLRSPAVNALKRVLSDDCELKQLWADNEELFPIWEKNIATLALRLAS